MNFRGEKTYFYLSKYFSVISNVCKKMGINRDTHTNISSPKSSVNFKRENFLVDRHNLFGQANKTLLQRRISTTYLSRYNPVNSKSLPSIPPSDK